MFNNNNTIIFIIFSLILIVVIFLNFTMYKDLQKLEKTLSFKKVNINSKYRIALIYKQNSDFTSLLSEGAKDAAEHLSIKLEEFYTGPSEQFTIKDYMDLAILAEYDGIIIDGKNSDLISPINEASKKNIPVITIISDLPASDRITYVGVNNHRAGYIIGRTLLEKFKNRTAKIAIISTKYSNENLSPTAEYLKIFGFKEAISSDSSASIITWAQIESNILKETELILDILNNYPEVNSIFTTNISATIAASNIKNKFNKEFYLIGYGDNKTLEDYLDKEILNANVYIDPKRIGKNSIKEIYSYLEDKKANLYSNIELELHIPENTIIQR